MPEAVRALLRASARVRARLGAFGKRVAGLSPTVRGMLWTTAAGLNFALLNALMRDLAIHVDPMQTQFLRYLFGLVAMLPVILRVGIGKYRSNGMTGQLWRGIVHTTGLVLWFIALPNLPLADVTAIGFTGPIFIMLGAAWFFGERMVAARWVAALIGFAGVLIVVAPKLSGAGGIYALTMLAASPVFAASFLITKALTRRDSPSVIVVWQSITVALFSAPLAWVNWEWPSATQWALFALSGVLGSVGHYCLTRSFAVADISATQPIKFLDLVWASLLGLIMFGDRPSPTALAGGAVILASTIWIARRESRARR